jgi:lipid II:glycine glycyltransferase (peptidoglycan interpeptide bridge formation enzyme)
MNELEGGRYASAELSNRHTFDDPRILLWRGWKIFPRYTYVVPVIDLTRQWDKVEQNIRRLISRCERDGMTLELSDDVDEFYTMHDATYRRKGIKPYISREKFVTLYEKLKAKDACQIYFARTDDGRRAAGQIVLMSKHPVTHTWVAGSDAEFLRSGASAFLRWKAFEDLNQRGYAYNDLTDAMNQRVAKFKSQFGGDLVPSFVIHKEISSKLRTRNRINNLLKKPVNMIRSKLMRKPKDEDVSPDE